MLDVDFFKENNVFFRLVGNHFILGDGDSGHISNLKEAVEEQVEQIYPNTIINWKPINAFMNKNKAHYGDNEDWQQLAENLPDDIYSAIIISQVAAQQQGGTRWLRNSDIEEVRGVIASYGQELEYLVNDKSDTVRRVVAEQGYGLEVLVKDFSPRVRQAVAEQGYGLDVLCKDSITDVRKAVAAQGYKLDFMILDKSPYVREEVAKQGYGLDVLSKDKSSIVQRGVKKYHETMDAAQ